MLTNRPDQAVERQYLSDLGFDFRYFTELAESKNGEPTYYCFDVGYSMRQDGIRFVRHPKYQSVLKAI